MAVACSFGANFLPLNTSTPDAGPLEATISNLKREISQRSTRLAEQQAQWLKQQEGLQAALASRAAAAEKLALAQSTHAVMDHRRARLERQ